jgi:hypothetical protein
MIPPSKTARADAETVVVGFVRRTYHGQFQEQWLRLAALHRKPH